MFRITPWHLQDMISVWKARSSRTQGSRSFPCIKQTHKTPVFNLASSQKKSMKICKQKFCPLPKDPSLHRVSSSLTGSSCFLGCQLISPSSHVPKNLRGGWVRLAQKSKPSSLRRKRGFGCRTVAQNGGESLTSQGWTESWWRLKVLSADRTTQWQNCFPLTRG